MKSQFYFNNVKVTLSERGRLKTFINSIFINEGVKVKSLNIVFCSDEYLLDINERFLNHNYYTDIITFNLAIVNQPVEGDIYISIDRVKENAYLFGDSLKKELHRVVFHGVLHLCGYRDKSVKDRKHMRLLENSYLIKYFF